MKKLLLIPLAFSLTFCNCTKSINSVKKEAAVELTCPDDGICTITIEKNKNLTIKTDALGSMYYQLLDDPTTSVIHYQYNRTVEEGLQDGGHHEEIIFEINNAVKKSSLKDKNLQETKMLFGRHCYCKGQAGYFKVENGVLNLTNDNGSVTLDLTFKINQVPQLFNTIKETIK